MQIITHPKIIEYEDYFDKPIGILSFSDFANKKYYREIPNGEKFLSLVHSERFIQKIKRASEKKATVAEIKLKPESYEVACLSIGAAILSSDQGDFAIGRLTGHHARKEVAAGFCLFNSIAIVAQRLVNQGKRVCIIDIDGHHGDGTQSIFYKTDKVLCCSIHQEGVFPGTGKENEIGSGEGKGYNLNIPIPKGSGDDIFLSSLKKIISAALDFAPDYVGVLAGFDGYHADSLLGLNYSLEGFHEAGKMIGSNFQNIFAILGGGYHRDIEKCIKTFVLGINQ